MEENHVESRLKIVIIGGSAGSLDVLMKVMPQINQHQNYALIIVLHRKNTDDDLLENLFSARISMPVCHVEDKTPLQNGCVFVAPSDYHLLVEKNGLLSLDVSEKINFSRPSIDVAFESAAEALGSSVCGILLSGANSDGTDGLIAIKKQGGTIVAQDPETATMPQMPQHAISHANVDFVFTQQQLVTFLNDLRF